MDTKNFLEDILGNGRKIKAVIFDDGGFEVTVDRNDLRLSYGCIIVDGKDRTDFYKLDDIKSVIYCD